MPTSSLTLLQVAEPDRSTRAFIQRHTFPCCRLPLAWQPRSHGKERGEKELDGEVARALPQTVIWGVLTYWCQAVAQDARARHTCTASDQEVGPAVVAELGIAGGTQGGFNPSSQHVLIGGVDEPQEVEVGSIAARQASLARETAGVASLRALAVLEGDLCRALERGRGQHCWRVAGRRQQMVPTMRRYATIKSRTVRTCAVGPLPLLRRA